MWSICKKTKSAFLVDLPILYHTTANYKEGFEACWRMSKGIQAQHFHHGASYWLKSLYILIAGFCELVSFICFRKGWYIGFFMQDSTPELGSITVLLVVYAHVEPSRP